MESLTIEIINPKAKKLLQDLADMNLIAIKQYFSNQNEDQEWHLLSKEQQQGILDALESINSGKGIPHEEIISEFQNKYNNG